MGYGDPNPAQSGPAQQMREQVAREQVAGKVPGLPADLLRKGNGGIGGAPTATGAGRLFGALEFTQEQLRMVESLTQQLYERLQPVMCAANVASQAEKLPIPESPVEAQLLNMAERLVGLQQLLRDMHGRLQI